VNRFLGAIAVLACTVSLALVSIPSADPVEERRGIVEIFEDQEYPMAGMDASQFNLSWITEGGAVQRIILVDREQYQKIRKYLYENLITGTVE